MDYFKGFLLQVQFLTRIPLPVKLPYDDKLLVKGFVLAPLVGLLPGLAMAGCYVLIAWAGQPLLSAAVVLLAELLVTGGLHLDGFTDTCDGLYSARDREKILAIMHDPHTGVFGVTGLIMLLITKTALLTALVSGNLWRYLVCLPVTGRCAAVWLAGLSRYAGSRRGMGAAYMEQCGKRVIAAASLVSLLLLTLFSGWHSLLPLAGVILYTTCLSRLLKKRIGGATGDTLGYSIETAEVLYLALLFCQETILRHLI